MTTRKYLGIDAGGKVKLSSDPRDSNNVFIMHPVIGVRCAS